MIETPGGTGYGGEALPRATRHADVPPPDLGAIAAGARQDRDRAAAVITRLERLADAAEAGAPYPPGTDAHAVALLIRDGRQIGSGLHALAGELSRLSLEDRLAGAVLAAERAEGRTDGAAAVRGRHRQDRPRKPAQGTPGLRVLPGGRAAVAAAAGVALIAGTVGTGAYSDLAHYAAAPAASHAAAAALPSLPADAAPLPSSPPSYAPRRPLTAAASATPAPEATLSPSAPVSPPPPAPSPSSPAPAVPVMDVPRFLDLGGSIRGTLTLAATGQGEVAWTATATDGITLSQYAGVAVQGQPVTLEVSDPTGNGGWIYVSFGGTTVPVHVTSSLGIPA